MEKTNVRVRDALPLRSERSMFCNAHPATEDTKVRMSMLLGIIFSNRSKNYQRDWAAGWISNGVHAPAEYAAMRLAADLTGIETPDSLQGFTAEQLAIESYGSALDPLISFAAEYTKTIA